MKKILFSLVIIISLFLGGASRIAYKDSTLSYLDVVRFKISSIYRKAIASEKPLIQDDLDRNSNVDAPQFSLLYSKKKQKYFKKLWKGYEQGFNDVSYTAAGIKFYQENRKWVKGKLVFEGDTFKVKIRAHGIQPDGHRVGDFFSYQIKVLKGKKVLGLRKFKLIIYERIGKSGFINQALANSYDLLWFKPQTLCKININGSKPKLFFIEEYELQKKDSDSAEFVRIEMGEYISGIDIMDIPKNELIESIGNAELDSVTRVDFISLNLCLQSRDSINIFNFFDEDYLMRYLAIKSIFRFCGHECFPGNVSIYYNKNNRKFYPAISREPQWMELDIDVSLKRNLCYYKHATVDRSQWRLNFYSTICSNEDFFSGFKEYLGDFVGTEKERIISIWDEGFNKDQDIIIGDWFLEAMYPRRDLQDIRDNFKTLETINYE